MSQLMAHVMVPTKLIRRCPASSNLMGTAQWCVLRRHIFNITVSEQYINQTAVGSNRCNSMPILPFVTHEHNNDLSSKSPSA
jgi:hypothetical protein